MKINNKMEKVSRGFEKDVKRLREKNLRNIKKLKA